MFTSQHVNSYMNVTNKCKQTLWEMVRFTRCLQVLEMFGSMVYYLKTTKFSLIIIVWKWHANRLPFMKCEDQVNVIGTLY